MLDVVCFKSLNSYTGTERCTPGQAPQNEPYQNHFHLHNNSKQPTNSTNPRHHHKYQSPPPSPPQPRKHHDHHINKPSTIQPPPQTPPRAKTIHHITTKLNHQPVPPAPQLHTKYLKNQALHTKTT